MTTDGPAGWQSWHYAPYADARRFKTPEEKIANSNIPREFQKVSMPDYVVEPPDLLLVEVLEALARPADLGRAAGAPRRQDLAGLLRRRLRGRPHDPGSQGKDRPPPAQVPHR